MEIVHTLFFFIITSGVLVSIHEFGHFWVARKVGVKVLKFSIGFGHVLWSYQKTTDSTEFVISAIPLGGYVKMVDEREASVSPEDLPYAFNRQSVWAKMAIVAAGPLFNLALAFILFWSVLVIGETGIKPVLDQPEPNSLVAQAGFVEGDEILLINDKKTPTWNEVINSIVNLAINGTQTIKLTVNTVDNLTQERTLVLAQEDIEQPENLSQHLGFKPWTPKLKPVIGQVLPNSAALAAGLQAGDIVLRANEKALNAWQEWVTIVRQNPAKSIAILIERDGVQLPKVIIPQAVTSDTGTEGKIGAAVYVPDEVKAAMTATYSMPPIEAIPAAFSMTFQYSWATVKMMGKMFLGQASVENLSGPISIAQFAGQSANLGVTQFLRFMGLVSVSLGVLNLLPIPVLDGGHLLFFTIEGIKGSPVSEKIQLIFQQAGIALLITLMTLAMFLDVQRLFH